MRSRSVAERERVAIEGFAALPTLTRANALGQYLFVNGRPVRDKLLLGSVRAAYADYLSRDRHPIVALFVTLDPREVDVNVHPAKTEVRFRNAGLVRALIVHALQEALRREGPARGRHRRDHRGIPSRCGAPRRLGLAPLARLALHPRIASAPCAARAALPRRRRPSSRSARRPPICASTAERARSARSAARRRARAGA